MTSQQINDAIQDCLRDCYASGIPLASMADYLQRLRDQAQEETSIAQVEAGVKRILAALMSQSDLRR